MKIPFSIILKVLDPGYISCYLYQNHAEKSRSSSPGVRYMGRGNFFFAMPNLTRLKG